jgi:hypothetical protein
MLSVLVQNFLTSHVPKGNSLVVGAAQELAVVDAEITAMDGP